MNSILKKLAGQTVIYGLSTIVGRFLNYLLLPIHTNVFKDPAQYGVITELYAYTAFLMIIFTYGMETTFFRFVSATPDKKKVFDTSLTTLIFSTVFLSGTIILLSQPIANALLYADHREYIIWFALILGLDAIVVIPFARLRQENRPLKFAIYKLINVGIIVFFNVFFLILIPMYLSNSGDGALYKLVQQSYNPDIGVGYVFISNLIACVVTLFMMGSNFFTLRLRIDFELWKKIMAYTLPLIVVGFAGMIDEMLSRAIMKHRLPVSPHEAMHQLGVFGANYKLAVLMTLYIQAYRMAAEPFFFNQSQQKDAKLTYARTMNYFIIGGGLIFLAVTLFMDLFKVLFISPAYYEGIHVVPILLMAQLFLGIYYNLTIWYKLTNKTGTGAMVAVYGAIVTLVLNWYIIPVYSYLGSSWITFFCYGSMVCISYWLGQKYFPVPYSISRAVVYMLLAVALFLAGTYLYQHVSMVWYYAAAVVLLGIYTLAVYVIEKNKIVFLKPV